YCCHELFSTSFLKLSRKDYQPSLNILIYLFFTSTILPVGSFIQCMEVSLFSTSSHIVTSSTRRSFLAISILLVHVYNHLFEFIIPFTQSTHSMLYPISNRF